MLIVWGFLSCVVTNVSEEASKLLFVIVRDAGTSVESSTCTLKIHHLYTIYRLYLEVDDSFLKLVF